MSIDHDTNHHIALWAQLGSPNGRAMLRPEPHRIDRPGRRFSRRLRARG